GVWAAITYWPADNTGTQDAGGLLGPLTPAAGQTEEPAGLAKADGKMTGQPDAEVVASGDGGLAAAADIGLIAKADTRKPKADRRRLKRGDRVRVAIRPPVKHPVQISSQPFFESITIDGKLVAKDDKSTQYGQRFVSELSEGKHRVVIKSRYCQDNEFEISVPSKEPFKRRLKFLPALVTIESELPEAEVYVNAKFQGSAASRRTKPVTITIEGKRPQKVVFVRLVDKNGGVLRKKVTVTAGEKTIIKAAKTDFKKAKSEGPK
ncbi:MAG: hypothetical protein JRJ87_23365, partial [Deltaproteobacteria bacterium]|nr:hypothetical protein [Deltaproteobacteria bacterium]